MRTPAIIGLAGCAAGAAGQSGVWLHDVPDATVLDPGESITVRLSMSFEGGGAPFVAYAVTLNDTLNVAGADLGSIEGWAILNDLDHLAGDVAFTDGVNIFEMYAAQHTFFGPFSSDNPIDVYEFTWTAAEDASGEVEYVTVETDFGLFVGADKDSADALSDLPVVEASFGWSVALCKADVNGDGSLNVLDFIAFQQAWLAQEPDADCDASGTYNALDFICYQNLYVAGCP